MKVLFSRRGGASLHARLAVSGRGPASGYAKFVISTIILLTSMSGTALAQIAFENTTGKALQGIHSETWGGAWGDYNGDYWPDLLIHNHRDRPSFYRNNGNGTFTDVILQVDKNRAWLSNRYADHHGVAFGDFDGDGDDDVFTVTNGCCPSQFMVSNKKVLREQGKARGLRNYNGSATAWLDWNRDGKLDVLADARMRLQNGAGEFKKTSPRLCDAYWLHLSDVNGDGVQDVLCGRDGTYPTKIWDLAKSPPAVMKTKFPKVSNVVDATSADFNNDLRPDYVFVRGTTLNNDARLVTPNTIEASFDSSPVQGRQAGMPGFSFVGGGVITLTFNRRSGDGYKIRVGSGWKTIKFSNQVKIKLDPNDSSNHGFRTARGTSDVFVGYNPSSRRWQLKMGDGRKWWMFYLRIKSAGKMKNVKTSGLRAVDKSIRPQIFHGSGKKNFVNRTFESGFAKDNLKCNSVVAEDFDNDMDVDLFFACTGGVVNLPNRVFQNDGNGKFTEVPQGAGAAGITGASLTARAGSSESVLSADYDNDGFVDVFVTNGINTQPTRFGGPHQIFRNRANGNKWASVQLVGTVSNPAGIGATIYATAGGVTQMRQYNGSYHRWSQNFKRAHFGLARNGSVQFRVVWPNGKTQYFSPVASNRLYVITEGKGIKAVTPGRPPALPRAQAGDQCGAPTYDPALDRGLFIHKNCNTGLWKVRAAAGGARVTRTFTGELNSNRQYKNVARIGLESGDRFRAGKKRLVFSMSTSSPGQDGLNFKVSKNAWHCLTLEGASGIPVYIGSKNRRIYPPVDLNTLGPCRLAAVPKLSLRSVKVNERVRNAKVQIAMSSVSASNVTVKFSTSGAGTARAGRDYYGVAKTITIKAGQRSAIVNVPIVNDRKSENTETLGVRIFDPTGASLLKGTATVSIIDND